MNDIIPEGIYQMRIIGITGTFGSGKSIAARFFADNGAYIIYHDKINHSILAKGERGYNALVREYGKSILSDAGEIDKKKVAKLAFSSNESLKRLEAVLHPIIIEIEQELVMKYKREHKYEFIVFDTPLLFEAGRDKVCDVTVTITSDDDILYERIYKKFGLSKDEAKTRISFQMSQKEKADRADHIIRNNGTIDELKDKIKRLFIKLEAGSQAAARP